MNYGRFYRLFNQLPIHTDGLKEDMVLKYTNGRTSSLRDMTPTEYSSLCSSLEKSVKDPQTSVKEELKRHRSIVLKLMQQLGIETADWARINAFCLDSRIAGEEFRDLTIEDLQALATKLRGIQRRGGLNSKHAMPATRQAAQMVYLTNNGVVN